MAGFNQSISNLFRKKKEREKKGEMQRLDLMK